MNYKFLGNSDLKVSTYCLGTMTFGETTSEEDGHYQLDESVASGINFIDTAEMYPTCPLRPETTGDTEIIVGNWISKNKSKDTEEPSIRNFDSKADIAQLEILKLLILVFKVI